MTDHTPSGLPQPQTVQRALIDALDLYLRQDETAGDTDNGVYRRGTEAMKAALSAPAVETVAVQEALRRARPFVSGQYNGLTDPAAVEVLDMIDAALSPLPVAPKAEPTDDQIMDAARPFAADGGRWPSDWIGACRAALALAQPVADRSAEPVALSTLTDEQIDAVYRDVWSTVTHAKRLSEFARRIYAMATCAKCEDWQRIARVQSAKLAAAMDEPGANERLKALMASDDWKSNKQPNFCANCGSAWHRQHVCQVMRDGHFADVAAREKDEAPRRMTMEEFERDDHGYSGDCA